MSLKIVYLDSGILINAFQGVGLVGIRAIEVLDNTACQFATSQFVRLETLPKAIYNQQQTQSFMSLFLRVLRSGQPN
ncbi:hypothetical protein AMR41_03300 [Hapalosiphon sp. MRB220]|nr:hypothetical protein AMR41_03300 [Hapalosiphon sp. MRB220]